MDEFNPMKHKKGLSWRVSLSIGTGIGWLIFLIIWLAFYALPSFYQNVAIFFASILAVIVILGASWASFGIKHIPEVGKEIMKATGMKTRIWASVIVFLAFMLFLIFWFWYYAGTGYSPYQNLAVFIVAILVMAGILGLMWARWGMKHGWKDKCKPTGAYYHHEKKHDDIVEEMKEAEEKPEDKPEEEPKE